MGVSKNRSFSPKMDGENNGSKPYEQMDDLGGNLPPLFLETSRWYCWWLKSCTTWDVAEPL